MRGWKQCSLEKGMEEKLNCIHFYNFWIFATYICMNNFLKKQFIKIYKTKSYKIYKVKVIILQENFIK